ncbi:MAG TPA: polysaccharide biosynthesis tyrosine autokinase [Dissulfurispiraceae bacterium]|nr:polysaccharide biosynthesis tyrosine autokinase [Dissulfurispiraceae bacterium]
MDKKDIHLKDYVRLIKKRRNLVLTVFISIFALALIITVATTSIYKASIKVLIEKNERANFMPGANYAYSSYDPEFYETQYQLITSAAVARKVVDLLAADQTFNTYFGKMFKATPDNKEARADAIAKMIRGGISVNPVKNSKIVDISYLSENPVLAQVIANTVAKAYIEELLEMSMSSTQYTIQWMTKKAEEEREKLEKSERSLQAYMKDQNFVAIEDKVAVVPQKITEINSQLIKAEAKRKETETLYNKVRGISANISDAESISAVASDPTVQSLRQQILKAEQQNMELSQKYGAKHPTMVRANEDLKGLKAKRDQEIRRVIDSIKNEYEMARSNEASLRGLLSQTNSEALNVNDKLIEYKVLSREAETNRQLYDALIKRIKEQSITEQVRSANVLIVENAEKPTSPVTPRTARNLLLGLLIGLLGGVGMVFFAEYLDQTIKSPEDAESKLGVSVLGMIPLLKTPEHPIEQMVLKEPISAFTENYKAIRTALLLSAADRPPQKILVTSAQPEEGKTVTAINLATAIAQSDYSVLLVDADLRKPRLYKALGLPNSKGLSTYLAGASDMNIIQAGPLPNLSIITSGPIPPNPSELLSSNRLHEMLRELGEKYDIIIFDAPPLLSVADSLILSKMLDGTLVIARAGKTSYDDVRKSLKSLTDLNARVLGVVINALDAKKNDYYYRYHTYYNEPGEKKD